MTLPLHGVRVLDLSNVLAGPFCGYNLARLGARVVKVENPRGGDLARRLGADPAMSEQLLGLSFVAVNAAKESVAIDLKVPAGREVFLRLVDKADVVLETFRPKVMERLGLRAQAPYGAQPGAHLLRDLRLRAGWPLGDASRLRPDRARALRRHERDRRQGKCPAACGISDFGHARGTDRCVRHIRPAAAQLPYSNTKASRPAPFQTGGRSNQARLSH